MSYDGIRDQLVSRIAGLGYAESDQAFDFENASSHEYENRFILNPISGTLEEDEDSLVDRFYDTQLWEIQIAFGRSEHSDVEQRNELNRRIVDIIKDLDNPTNWEGVTNGARNQRYQSWEITPTDNYFLLTIIMRIVDEVTH